MATLDDYIDDLTVSHRSLKSGTEFSLVEIMGERWKDVEVLGQETNMGRQYRRAVGSGRFPEIEFVRIAPIGRHNVYCKVRESKPKIIDPARPTEPLEGPPEAGEPATLPPPS
jgi:hypothetical protein